MSAPTSPILPPASSAPSSGSGGAGRARRDLSLCGLVALLSLASSALVGAFFPRHVPQVHDELAYLLAGETFANFRLTNPTPPLWPFFEAPHVLLQPSYMPKYPPGHGFSLAAGIWLGNPLYGVWLEGALFAGTATWLLLGFFRPRWALLGGLAIVMQFGLTHYWVQSYWGGALAGAGGALVFGGAARLWRRPSRTTAAAMAAGAVILMLTRPFEGLLACLVPGLLLLARLIKSGFAGAELRRCVLPFAAVAVAGALFLAYYQFRVTGSPWRAPYLEYERQYSSAPLFIWKKPGPEPVFRNASQRDFYRDYVLPMSTQSTPPAQRWLGRLRVLAADFLGAPLTVAALGGLLWRPRRWPLLALASIAVISVALVVCHWFDLHYQAPAAALYIFLAIAGARTLFFALPRRARKFGAAVTVLGAVQLTIFARTLSHDRRIEQLGATTLRQRVIETLHAAGGRHLVFVQLEKPYDLSVCWVYNGARLADSPVVWAWDRGETENRQLCVALPGRRSVLMTLRGTQISFVPYPPAPPP